MNNNPESIVGQMMKNDYFSQWLGIEILKINKGYCKLQLKVRKEMLNGFNILHGGISYSIADSALAFASNSHGIKSVSIETSISHIEPCRTDDILIAEAEEQSLSNKIGIYYVSLYTEANKKIALFKGTVYRTGKEWET